MLRKEGGFVKEPALRIISTIRITVNDQPLEFDYSPQKRPDNNAPRPFIFKEKLLNLLIMQVQEDIEFNQLLKIVKSLPAGKLRQLKAEIEKEEREEKSVDLETLLLNGPTATKKQLETIARNRKAINQWRTK